MKKQVLALLAAVAFIGVGCERGDEANEPAGAGRESMDQSTYGTGTSTNTNAITEPSGAGQESGAGATNGASQSGAEQGGTGASQESGSSSQQQSNP